MTESIYPLSPEGIIALKLPMSSGTSICVIPAIAVKIMINGTKEIIRK